MASLFCHKFWEVVHKVVEGASLDFFDSGDLLNELNVTNTILIPKIPHPESITQFRPIILCTFSYKIIAKVLSNCLKACLLGLISHNQSAFVPNRLIHDNIIVAHKAFHFLRLRNVVKRCDVGVKLDMHKAYDHVEWDFFCEKSL